MLRRLAHLILRLGSWTTLGENPDAPKAVVIAAPHTSNWDGVWALTYKVAVGLDIRFFAKQSLFWFPLGTLLRGLGGVPLNRDRARSAVDQAVAMFEAEESLRTRPRGNAGSQRRLEVRLLPHSHSRQRPCIAWRD